VTGVDSALALERIAAAHWRGTEEEWLGGWLLRAADGFTGRANSALPLGPPGLSLDTALAALTAWYRARGLPPMMAIPVPAAADAPAGELAGQRALDAELARREWRLRAGPAFVMVAGIPAVPPVVSLPPGLEFRAGPVPDDAWLAAYHYRGQEEQPPVMRAVLTSAADQVFLSIRASTPGPATAGTAVAIARLSLSGGWAGITAVEVRPEYRRTGLGRALTGEACARAAARAVKRVFLQVEEGNQGARMLYERAGFRYSHRYHYRLAPE
jgi:GNAT superfamily N-acetyltransferase